MDVANPETLQEEVDDDEVSFNLVSVGLALERQTS